MKRTEMKKEEKKLRERGDVEVYFKVTADVDELREFGGDLPQTRFSAFWYEEDQKWICNSVLMDEVVEAETVNKLIEKLETEIRADEVVESVKFDEVR